MDSSLVASSSLEKMLESIKQREEQSSDVPPPLATRPTSKARRPSPRRSHSRKSPEQMEEKKEDVGSPMGKELFEEKNNESTTIVVEQRTEKTSELGPRSRPLSSSIGFGENGVSSLNKDEGQDLVQVHPSFLKEFQKRVLNAESDLRQKREENAKLQQQLEQSEAMCSEYVAKIKCLEEIPKRPKASLQLAMQNDLVVSMKNPVSNDNDIGNQHERPAFFPTRSEEIMLVGNQIPEETHRKSPACGSDVHHGAVKHMAKEFEQKKEVFNEAIEHRSGKPDLSIEELRKLKRQFLSWKKDYKTRLHEMEESLQKIEDKEMGKIKRKWWGKLCTSGI